MYDVGPRKSKIVLKYHIEMRRKISYLNMRRKIVLKYEILPRRTLEKLFGRQDCEWGHASNFEVLFEISRTGY